MKHNWLILGQSKTILVVFLWKMRTNSVVFLATILFLMALYGHYKQYRDQKDNWTSSPFSWKATRIVFLWPNMGQLCFKVLIYFNHFCCFTVYVNLFCVSVTISFVYTFSFIWEIVLFILLLKALFDLFFNS